MATTTREQRSTTRAACGVRPRRDIEKRKKVAETKTETQRVTRRVRLRGVRADAVVARYRPKASERDVERDVFTRQTFEFFRTDENVIIRERI